MIYDIELVSGIQHSESHTHIYSLPDSFSIQVITEYWVEFPCYIVVVVVQLLSYPSLFPGVCSNLCPFNRWCHTTISSSVIPFSSHLQSFPASGSFPMSWLFASGGQSIGDSASASVLPMNIQHWFPSGRTGLIFLQSKGLSRVFSSTTVQRHQFFGTQPSLWSNSHIYTWLLEKP